MNSPRFEVFFDSELIGYSNLEFGDPPMGVAFGQFIPNQNYQSVRPRILNAQSHQEPLNSLSVSLSGGQKIESTGGAHISDYFDDLGPEGLQLEVLGISYPSYGIIFPEHVAAYENQFPPCG